MECLTLAPRQSDVNARNILAVWLTAGIAWDGAGDRRAMDATPRKYGNVRKSLDQMENDVHTKMMKTLVNFNSALWHLRLYHPLSAHLISAHSHTQPSAVQSRIHIRILYKVSCTMNYSKLAQNKYLNNVLSSNIPSYLIALPHHASSSLFPHLHDKYRWCGTILFCRWPNKNWLRFSAINWLIWLMTIISSNKCPFTRPLLFD